jgi:hypothetical protein
MSRTSAGVTSARGIEHLPPVVHVIRTVDAQLYRGNDQPERSPWVAGARSFTMEESERKQRVIGLVTHTYSHSATTEMLMTQSSLQGSRRWPRISGTTICGGP